MSTIERLRDIFPRVLGISTFDTGGTILITWYIARMYNLDFKKSLISAFILGEIVHIIFNQSTPITKFLL